MRCCTYAAHLHKYIYIAQQLCMCATCVAAFKLFFFYFFFFIFLFFLLNVQLIALATVCIKKMSNMHMRRLFVCPTHVRFHRLLRLISSYIFYNKIHDRKFTTKKIQQKIKILKLHPGINIT